MQLDRHGSAPALHVVGIGGTARPNSSSEQALRLALRQATERGATTRLFSGRELAQLPMYLPDPGANGGPIAHALIENLRRADGVIIASPGYHGSTSGLLKNALDYVEEMRADPLPYLSDRAVGLITTAQGWQAAVGTLFTLRSVVHALRGWNTPFGAAINSTDPIFVDGNCVDARVAQQLVTVADEVIRFADLVASRRVRVSTTRTAG